MGCLAPVDTSKMQFLNLRPKAHGRRGGRKTSKAEGTKDIQETLPSRQNWHTYEPTEFVAVCTGPALAQDRRASVLRVEMGI